MTEVPLVEVWVPDAPWMESWLTPEQHLDHQRQLFHELAGEVGMDEAKAQWDDWEALVVEAGSGEVPFPEEDWEQVLLERLQEPRVSETMSATVVDSSEGCDADGVKEGQDATAAAEPVPSPPTITRLPSPTSRSIRVGEPTPDTKADFAYARARDTANTRWIAEMQVKYNVPYLDEEDYDLANLTTTADHRRYTEIKNEELAAVTFLEP